MAKELPYFQFEPAQYLTGSIQFCSMEAQGLFMNINCLYWQRDCELSLDQINKRFDRPKVLQELIDNKIIKVKDGMITIIFLKNQLKSVVEISKKRSASGKKGNKKRWSENGKPIASESQTDRKSIAIREDKIREDEIKGNKIKGVFVFIPPTQIEIENILLEGQVDVELEKIKNLAAGFFDHFSANGWLVGKAKAPMKDWKAAVRTWVRNEKKFENQKVTKGNNGTNNSSSEKYGAVAKGSMDEYMRRPIITQPGRDQGS